MIKRQHRPHIVADTARLLIEHSAQISVSSADSDTSIVTVRGSDERVLTRFTFAGVRSICTTSTDCVDCEEIVLVDNRLPGRLTAIEGSRWILDLAHTRDDIEEGAGEQLRALTHFVLATDVLVVEVAAERVSGAVIPRRYVTGRWVDADDRTEPRVIERVVYRSIRVPTRRPADEALACALEQHVGKREVSLLTLRYGLGEDARPMTLRAVAETIGASDAFVGKSISAALATVRAHDPVLHERLLDIRRVAVRTTHAIGAQVPRRGRLIEVRRVVPTDLSLARALGAVLDPRSVSILTVRFGLAGGPVLSQEGAAEQLQISGPRINVIERAALETLRTRDVEVYDRLAAIKREYFARAQAERMPRMALASAQIRATRKSQTHQTPLSQARGSRPRLLISRSSLSTS